MYAIVPVRCFDEKIDELHIYCSNMRVSIFSSKSGHETDNQIPQKVLQLLKLYESIF